MKNKASHGNENLDRSEHEMTDHFRQIADSKNSRPYYEVLSADGIFSEDFQEEEPFILREEFVMMEEEYVMWEGTAPCSIKNRAGRNTDVFEEEATLPEDDSLHHLNVYYTLKTGNRTNNHY